MFVLFLLLTFDFNNKKYFRLGSENEDGILKRPPVQIRVASLTIGDARWHKFTLFQVG